MDEKKSGFGIGELGSVPENTPEDMIDTLRIDQQQKRDYLEHLENARLNNGGCTVVHKTSDGTYERCGKTISKRLYHSGAMGSGVLCEEHFVEYWMKFHPDWPPTFEGVMEKLHEKAVAERNRVKHCARCGSTNATWNSSAGKDLCQNHWDEY